MADRYWVGGAGTWDATTTTNWSATSGGASGASAPTSVDNVIFNTLSNATAYAVTVGTNANALDITIAGPAVGNVSITGTSASIINCYGNWLNAATGVAFTGAGGSVIRLQATTAGKTLTFNNVNTNNWAAAFLGIGGGWTLGSAYTSGSGFIISNGAFSTGNFAVTVSNIFGSSIGTRSVTLGTSTITLNSATPWTFSDTTNLTFSGASSTIICNNAAPTFAGGGLTYGTVNFTSTTGDSITTISGVNTFTNLNQTSPSSLRRLFLLSANQTVTGTLTLGAANAYNARVQVQSQSVGTPITLTVATIATLSDVDFRDITAAGASGTWSGTRLGNGLGNTNITFVAGKTVYWNLVAGGVWSSNAWATSSGGAVATANFPLAQDTAIIEDTGLTAGNTITINSSWSLGTLNCTRTAAWTYAGTGLNIYLNFTITSVTTVTNTGNQAFLGRSTQTITTNGVSLAGGVSINNIGSTVVLNGNLTTPAASTTTLSFGTLDLAGFTLSTGIFNSNNSNTRAIAFGVGKIAITSSATTVFTISSSTGFSLTGTPLVELTTNATAGTRSVFLSNFSEANSISVSVTAGSDTVDLITTTIGAYRNINFTSFTGTISIPNTTFCYGNFDVGGATALSGTAAIQFKSTSGVKTIRTNNLPLLAIPTFDGIGGTWLCTDAFTTTSALTLTNGTLKLAAGTTSTVGSFVTTGTNMKYLLSSVPTFQAQISDASGTNTVTYLTIQDNYATGGATWNATDPTNVDAGNNYGWTFSSVPASSAQITMGLRSFTQFRG